MGFVKLDEVAKFINGYAFKPTDWSSEGTKIIRIQNLTDPNKPCNRASIDVPAKFHVSKGDMLVSWSATLDVFVWNDDEPGLLNQHIFKVVHDPDIIDKNYFVYALRASISNMSHFTHGSTMKHIVRKDFLNHLIPLPNLDEQKRIVKILEDANVLIQKREQSTKLLEKYLDSVFIEMFGDLRSNPKKWNKLSLKEITNKITDGTHQSPKFVDEGIPFIFISNIVQNEITLNTKKYISEETYQDLTKSTPIEKYDILYTTVGSYGHPAIVKTDAKFCFQRHIAHIKPDTTKTNVYFLYGMLKTPYIRHQADKKAKGVAQKTLNLGELSSFQVILPPMDMQNRYADVVAQVEKLKQYMLKQSIELNNHFQSLLQSVFSANE